ncbi:VTT domain-containing protein [Priestia megaterium]|nr:VTT domain-containing protein [Priestia megaterium]
MNAYLESLLLLYPELAIFISIFVSVIIGILGVIPSAFWTAVHLKVFGVLAGTLLLVTGEVVGAAVSFWLYRKGFNRLVNEKVPSYPKVKKLLHVTGKDALLLVFILRLLPFVPSSIVTFFAAVGKMSFAVFITASILGKIPALAIEIYAVYQVVSLTKEGQMILGGLLICLILYIWKKSREK